MGTTVPVLTVVATIGKQDEAFQVAGISTTVETSVDVEQSAPPAQGTVAPTDDRPVAQGLRQFVSPRARKLAKARGVDLKRVTPTGGEGIRVIEKDVQEYLNHLPKTTPLAAAMASELGVDLVGIVGSGLKGSITKADIEKALREKPTPPPAPATHLLPPEEEVIKRIPLKGVRGIIFERMGTSAQTTARVTLVTEVDATEFVAAREKLKEIVSQVWGFTPGYNDLLGVIVARGLREYPYMNARVSQDGKAIEWLRPVNLGIAVDTDRGLLVPVVRDADHKGLRAFGEELRQMVERARTGHSLLDDITDGTFTITNLGTYDVDAFTPVINLPEAAILGVGRIVEKVVPYQGQIAIRKMLTLSLVFDHRLNDGAPAARFLQWIKQQVETPTSLYLPAD